MDEAVVLFNIDVKGEVYGTTCIYGILDVIFIDDILHSFRHWYISLDDKNIWCIIINKNFMENFLLLTVLF